VQSRASDETGSQLPLATKLALQLIPNAGVKASDTGRMYEECLRFLQADWVDVSASQATEIIRAVTAQLSSNIEHHLNIDYRE
jgi:hypothetical protein